MLNYKNKNVRIVEFMKNMENIKLFLLDKWLVDITEEPELFIIFLFSFIGAVIR